MSRHDLHNFRRKLVSVEQAVLVLGAPTTAAEVHEALDALAGAADAAERVEELAAVAAGQRPRDAYIEAHGACGVRRFVTAGGRTIYLLPVETFPDHVNNVYLVLDGTRKLLVDAGSLAATSRADFARAAEVLATIYGVPAALEGIDDILISHAHVDHYGAVGVWRQQGARVHAHELDARVLTRFDERIVVAALGLRQFLQAAGVPGPERTELVDMYVYSKNMFKSVPVDRTLTDGAVVHGAIAHHTPGHCPGQVCLQVDNVLLTADHVLPRITPHQAPESITQSTGLDHYFDALEKIRRVGGIDLGLPGHEEPIPRLSQRIVEIESFHRARLDKVLAICRTEPHDVRAITASLFGEQKGYGRILAYEEAGAHVEFLSRRGQLEIANLDAFLREENPVVLYRSAS
jgi:glyoxylase-like metal-dependent hydrolase (beta-lactamase superfamily II)